MKKLLCAVVLATLFAAPALATSFVRVSDEALVDGAPLIVVGTVEARSPAAGGAAATDYRLRVEEVLKGSAPEEITVRVPGGGSGPVRLKVWGAPQFGRNERVLLFLRPRANGAWSIQHLFLGAFHEVVIGNRRLALRALSEVHEVRVLVDGEAAPPEVAREPVRDFAAFTRWVAARGKGQRLAAGYTVSGDDTDAPRGRTSPFTLFEDPDSGLNLRWFIFDSGGNATFLADNTGLNGLTGGGFGQFQTALQAWNAESATPIDYRYGGKTNDRSGLLPDEPPGCDPDINCQPDTVNTIVFEDPNDELDDFTCNVGGVLAYGGPWYEYPNSSGFHGNQYHRVLNADIVVNKGLACFFNSSPSSGKAAEELFGHELGHTLGIGHSCGDTGGPSCNNATFDAALMRAFVHDDGRGAALNGDDRAALRSLYEQTASGTPPAKPTSLTGSASSTSEILLEWNDNATNETDYRVEMKPAGAASFQELLDLSGDPELDPNLESISVIDLAPATGYFFRVRAHNAAGFSEYSNEVLVATNSTVTACVEDTDTLCVNNDRFVVEVDWETSTGSTGVGNIVPLPSAPDSGLFYFFSPSNIEMLVKVLNACTPALGNKYWVFYAATTNVEFTLTVTDTQTSRTKVYFNPLNTPAAPVQDTNAFATCP